MKTIIKLLLGLLLVGAVGIVVINQNAIAAARAEHKTLLLENGEALQLAEQNKEITKLREQHAEWENLRAANQELPKLRNEVRQLRRQAEEMRKLRTANEMLKSGPRRIPSQDQFSQIMGDSFPRAELKDVGLVIPRATLQTYYSAMCANDLPRVLQCLGPAATAALGAETGDIFREKMRRETEGFTGYEITGRSQKAPDEVVLTIKLTATAQTREMRFNQVGNEWKLNP